MNLAAHDAGPGVRDTTLVMPAQADIHRLCRPVFAEMTKAIVAVVRFS